MNFFISCQPDEPEGPPKPQQPEMKWELHALWDANYDGYPLWTGAVCPYEGTTCAIYRNGTSNQRKQAFETFSKYYEEDNLKGYFDLYKDYDLILPGIDKSDYISKIVAKTYLVNILNDKTIVLYKNDGKPLNYDNLIFGFKIDFEDKD